MELLGELEAGPQGFKVTLGEGGLPDAQVVTKLPRGVKRVQ